MAALGAHLHNHHRVLAVYYFFLKDLF